MSTLSEKADDTIRFTDAESMTVVPRDIGAVRVPVQSNPTDQYGVAVARVSFGSNTSIVGTATHHMIGIGCSEPVPTEHMIDGKRLHHNSGPGCLCICPADAKYFTAFSGPMTGIIMRVSPECLALAKAALTAHHAALVERMNGKDPFLTRTAQILEAEAEANHPNGMLFWSCVTDALLTHLAQHHLSTGCAPLRAPLDISALRRIEDFINANLSESLDLDSLAAVAGCNRFQFARLFRAAVGISPHRYVVRRRLQCARAMLHSGNSSLAEISASTGFSDQSHLTKWIKRVYGTTPAQLAA